MVADDTITYADETTDIFQDGDILMKMDVVRPKEYLGKEYKSGLVKGKQARSKPARACDCFDNLAGHATWDSKFYGGATYACKVLEYNKIEIIFADLLGSVKKINGRYLFLFQPRKEKAPCQRSCVRAQLSLKEVGWGPPAEPEALQDGV